MRGSVASAAGQPGLHLGPGDRVERGEGLVERQHRLAGDQGAQEGDPLAHPARELGRRGVARSRRGRSARTARAACRRASPPPQRRGCAAPGRRCRAPRARAAAGRAGACRRSGARRRAGARRRRRPRSRPRSGSGGPQISSSRVDLPQPDGPDQAEHPVRGSLEVEAVDRPQLPVGMLRPRIETRRRAALGRRSPRWRIVASRASWYPGALRAPDQKGQESR